MHTVLLKTAFTAWAEMLADRELWAPVLADGVWDYGMILEPEALRLDCPQTVQSPKKIIFPQREVLLDFETAGSGTATARERLPAVRPAVVFGVRPCDARALLLTDKVFGGAFPDPYYRRRRDAVTLVGLACTVPPSPNCFCPTVGGSPVATLGLDVLMTDCGDGYAVETLTEKGRDLVARGGRLFTPATAAAEREREKLHAASTALIRRRIEGLADVRERLRGLFDAAWWESFAAPCIRCGICTYLCPTCHCFDIADEITSSHPMRGERVRTWDTCQFPDFTMHSSGHNPRPDKASRQRQRILHKFLYFPDIQGDWQCTGCGRCITLCPVGVDLLELLGQVKAHGK